MKIRSDLKKMLFDTGWSQTHLAKRSDVSQSAISKLLSGKAVRSDTLEKLWPFIYGDQRPTKSQATQ
ncbi:MAG: helix-turn-helix domain-containing protein [Pseudodesulfovibrio sp.]|nr:helix-turn-helix domain-containing protein [Pseudodesulfovibrio sp.]